MNSKASNHLHDSSDSALDQLLVGLLQYKGDRASYRHSCDRLIEIIDSAGKQGVKLLVTPECSCSEYTFTSKDEALSVSEQIDGELADHISGLAQHHQMWCVVGMIEQASDHELFNAAFIFSADGSRYCYRKRLLFDADHIWSESGDLKSHQALY